MGKDPNYISLQTATKFCDYTQEYLSLRARQGKLKAVKFGRNWVTKEEWLKEYLGKAEEYNNHINNKVSVETVVKKTPSFSFVLKPIFSLGLVFILLTANIAFGKENFKNIFEDVDSGAAKISGQFGHAMSKVGHRMSKFGAFGKEGVKIVEEGVRNSVSNVLFDSRSRIKSVGRDVSSFADNINFGVAEIGEGAGKNLKDYFSLIKSNYSAADSFVEKKFINNSRTLLGLYGDVNNFVEEGLRNSVSKIRNQVSEKVSDFGFRISNLGRFVSAPWKKLLPEKIVEVQKEEKQIIKEIVKEVEVSKITRVEPVKEITKEIFKVDDKALVAVRAQLVDMETAIANRLYAPGGVITQQIYIKEPVSSPKIYQENADIILQALGTGNVILTAGVGMQISGSQVIIDSTSVNNPLVYIADRTKIGGNTEISGSLSADSLTAQTITLNAPATFSGKVLDLQVGGVSQFSVDNTGTMLFNSGLTSSSTLNVYGTTTLATIQGNIGIGTSTPSEKLTVVGNIWGSGNIVLTGTSATSSIASPFYTQATTTFGSATSTPIFFTGYVKSNILPFADSAYDFGSSAFRWANIYTATATVNNLSALNTLTVAGTTTLATSQGFVGIGTTTPSEILTIRATSTNAVFGAYSSSSAPLLYITSAGNIGIGTAAPTSTLQVAASKTINFNSSPVSNLTLGTNMAGGGYNLNNVGSLVAATIYSIYNQSDNSIGMALDNTAGADKVIQFQTRNTANDAYLPRFTITNRADTANVYFQNSLVGIGTTTPGYTLSVVGNIYGTGNAIFAGTLAVATTTISSTLTLGSTGITATAASTWQTTGSASALTIQSASTLTASSTSDIIFATAGSERMRIASSTGNISIGTSTISTLFSVATSTNIFNITTAGAVGIGTSTPAYTLDVYGTLRAVSTSTFAGATFSGNVGIGTTEPAGLLDLRGGSATIPLFTAGAGMVASDFQAAFDTNGRFGLISGSGTSPSYGVMLLASNASEATSIELGSVIFGQKVSGKSGFTPGFKAQITGVTSGSGGTTGGFGGNLTFRTRPDNGGSDIGAYERMRIDSSGNVGIGTTTPSELLTVWGGGMFVGTSSTPSLYVASTTGRVGIGTSTPAYTLDVYGTLRAVSTSTLAGATFSGNVGIGTTTPQALLNVWGSNASSTLTVSQTGAGNIVDFQAISTSVFTLKTADQLKYRDGLMTTWGDFNSVVQDDFETGSVAGWTSSDTTNSKVSATTTQVKVNDYSFAITTVVGSSGLDTATTTATTTDWSSYERLGYWIMAQYNSTSSAATTSDIISFRFKDSGGTTSVATTTIKEFGRWQYKEVDLTVFPSGDKDVVQWLGFRVENDYGSPTFYIDQIRLYDSNERTAEMFVDLNGNLNLVSPSKIEFTRTIPGGDSLPSLSIGAAVIELNQPLAVNVGGDVGMDQDLVFNNTGMSSINSAGPLTISAGNNWAYQNLTLKTGGTGDIIMDIASSTIGFKITGPATSSFGAYVFRVTSAGAVDIGATTTISGNLMPSASNTYNLGSSITKWSYLFVATSTVGDIVFANQFKITEAMSTSSSEKLIFQNASSAAIMTIDENGVLTVDTLKTSQLCVGSVCVTEAQFNAVFNPPTNTAPVANSFSATTTLSTPISITLSATDADGNSLTYATTSSPTIGVLTGTAPNLTYTPNATGTDSFNYKANDGTADSNTATVNITISE